MIIMPIPCLMLSLSPNIKKKAKAEVIDDIYVIENITAKLAPDFIVFEYTANSEQN